MQSLLINDKVLKMDCYVRKKITPKAILFWNLNLTSRILTWHQQLVPRRNHYQPKTHTKVSQASSMRQVTDKVWRCTLLDLGPTEKYEQQNQTNQTTAKVNLLSGGVGCSHARVWVSLGERCWGEEADQQQGGLTIHNSDIIATIASSLSHPSVFTIIMNIWRRGWLTQEVKVTFLVTQSQYIGRNDKLRSSSVGSYKSLLLPIYPLLAFVDPQKKTNWIAAQWNTNQLGNLLWHTQAQIFTQVVQYLDI